MVDYFELIDDYKNELLSEEIRKEFVSEMGRNEALKSAVHNYDLIKEISLSQIELEIRDVLNEEVESTRNNSTPVIKLTNWIYGKVAFILLLISVGGYYIYQKEDPFEHLEFASLYEEPAWPIDRGISENELSRGIKLGLDGSITKAVKHIKSIDLPIGERNYWIAELFTKASIADSALYYLPISSTSILRRDRINYLKIINLYQLKKYHQVKQLINELPDDTDIWYKKLYRKID